jgi:hypothetical protein
MCKRGNALFNWNKEDWEMKTAMKGVALVLLAVAAVRIYPDFARYMRIRAM